MSSQKSIPTKNPDWFPVPDFCVVQEEQGNSKVFIMVLAVLPPTAPFCQTVAPVIALHGGYTPAFPAPNLITTCFFTNYNAQIIEELKATVAGRLEAVSFLLRWPHYNFTSF